MEDERTTRKNGQDPTQSCCDIRFIDGKKSKSQGVDIMLIGYARVSTKDQNADLQVNALKAAGCEKTYIEKASGGDRGRPILLEAVEYMRSGVDVLVVWKLDRLARSLSHLSEIINQLAEKNIGFRSLTENMDTTTAGGKMIFHLFGAMAEFERDIIRERTMAGLQAARDRGKFGGRKHLLNNKDIAVAKTLLMDSSISADEVASRMKISSATLYRYFPGGRSKLIS